MDKEVIDKKIKNETELFKVFSFFIIALGTGNLSLYLREDFEKNDKIITLFVTGVIIFTIFIIGFIRSFFKINRLNKKL